MAGEDYILTCFLMEQKKYLPYVCQSFFASFQTPGQLQLHLKNFKR